MSTDQYIQFDIETLGTYQVDFELGPPFFSMDKSFTYEITE